MVKSLTAAEKWCEALSAVGQKCKMCTHQIATENLVLFFWSLVPFTWAAVLRPAVRPSTDGCEALSAFSHACASCIDACMHVWTWTLKKYFLQNPFTFSIWNNDSALFFALDTNLKPDFAAVYTFTPKKCTPGFSIAWWTPCNNFILFCWHVFRNGFLP